MSTKKLLNWSFIYLIAVCLVGCDGKKTTTQGPTDTDPIQQETEAKVKSKGPPKEVPPGFMMNSGGQIVPVAPPTDSDQP